MHTRAHTHKRKRGSAETACHSSSRTDTLDSEVPASHTEITEHRCTHVFIIISKNNYGKEKQTTSLMAMMCREVEAY